ncbi:glycosyltransferase family 92-domain-containing protein [Entophlyctis helioformis]|nr:glycosyltransferase family 92-domain-containing protein [Entophlyctis helioformis]
MMRNKAEYVAEWVEFHLLQGFDKFVIYNHMSTDNIRQQLMPYTTAGIVELVDWPVDYDTIAKPPNHPREWTSDERRVSFERVFKDECLQINDTWHIHGGCQRTAMIDGIARYRKRSEWLSIFDVDEFLFSPASGKETANTTSIVTVRDILMSQGEQYDHIRIPGKIFGTNGYFNDPPRASDFSRRLVTEAYRYRYNFENGTRYHEGFLKGRSYTEKSFARSKYITGTLIHHFTFEDVKPSDTVDGKGIREIRDDYKFMAMNHYQYLSHMGQNKKSFSNTNWALDYWRPVDMLFTEVADYTIGYLVPILDFNLRRRMAMQPPERLSLPDLAQRNVKRAKRLRISQSRPLELCIAFTHIEGQAHHLRRSMLTIQQYLDTTESDIHYKMVLVMNNRTAPAEPTSPESVYLRDVLDLADTVEILPAHTFWVVSLDRAQALCSDAQYTLSMEDLWETRIRTNSLADYSRPGFGFPILRQAMQLMEHEKSILEVWVGDTPSQPVDYKHVQSRWIKARFLPEVDKTASNMRLLRQHIRDSSVRNAVWDDLLQMYMKENRVMQRFGKMAMEKYVQVKNESKGGWVWSSIRRLFSNGPLDDTTANATLPGVSLSSSSNQGSSASNEAAAAAAAAAAADKASSGAPQVLSKDNGVWANAPSPLEGDSRSIAEMFYGDPEKARKMKDLANSFYKAARLKLNCFPQMECLSRVTYYRTQGLPGGSGLAVVRIGGSLKHNGRLKQMATTWLQAADDLTMSVDTTSQVSMLAIQEAYGRVAADLGFKSAQFCLTAPEFQGECDLNPDFVSDRAVTGIMWRQRLVLDGERDKNMYPDRPQDLVLPGLPESPPAA